ncbi:N-acetylglucosaminyltransferase [Pseudoalteromonas phenolica]|uniref:beta-1,6-N-acetylglucosaminyltransferase n=1 Tax=Pseudoalteromonas phenolica TaxID=161398 RepID=UPI00110A2758|nr:beta-1,6-N-acetylglucosaminyltransferase [Pseudoalteromonas phenolica]TMN92336.1 N-acetylglucosaminyltransferase [Pseudoalteromonas phenolica]
MRIAILVACHKQAELINKLIAQFDPSFFKFFIHVDIKSDISEQIIIQDNVVLITDDDRVDVRWGHISQVYATYNLLKRAAKEDFDYLWFMSGQDFPIKSQKDILDFFVEHNGRSFIDIETKSFSKYRALVHYPFFSIGQSFTQRVFRKLYAALCMKFGLTKNTKLELMHGSSWFCFHKNIYSNIINDRDFDKYLARFENALCPDEIVFQTYIKHKGLDTLCNDNLTYVDWSAQDANPKLLTLDDYNVVINSSKLIARKFDLDVDSEIIHKLSALNE